MKLYDSIDNDYLVFKPNDIKGFYIRKGERLFETKIIKLNSGNNNIFLRCLVNSYYSLYGHMESTSKERYFLIDNEGSIMRLDELDEKKGHQSTKKPYLGILKYKMQDKPELYRKIENVRFSNKDLISLFKSYMN